MTILKSINLGAAFVLELCMLAALAYWGFQTGSTTLLKIAAGVGLPLLAATIWGLFMAPRAARRLSGAAYLLVKFILFGAAALGLAAAGQGTLAVVFAVASVINQVLLLVWKQETPEQISA